MYLAIVLHVALLLFVFRMAPTMLRSLDLGTVLFFRLYSVCGTLVCRVRLQLEVDKLHHHGFLRAKLSVSYLIVPSWGGRKVCLPYDV